MPEVVIEERVASVADGTAWAKDASVTISSIE
jgi:hypothetical protein